MSIISNIPKEVKDGAVDATSEALKDYSKSESKTDGGSFLRKVSKVIYRILPFLKYIKINKKP